MTNTTNTAQRIADTYGVQESNGLADGLADGLAYHRGIPAEEVTLAQVAQFGARISRVRILAENVGGRYRCDVSYIHAERDGIVRRVRVEGGIGHDLYGRGPLALKRYFIEWATEQGVSAKALGLLDEGNWSVLKG